MTNKDPDYYNMTPAREAHLRDIKYRVLQSVDAKYRAGQAEHGNDLFAKFDDKQLLQEIENELIDLIVYVYTLRAQIYGEADYNKRSGATPFRPSEHATELGETGTDIQRPSGSP